MNFADLAEERDAATFVAREGELAALRRLLEPDGSHRLAFVTGSAGMGKTALLRETVRRARRSASAYDPVWIDARELGVDRRLDDVLAGAASLTRPLLVLDSAEELGTGEAWLREHGLAELPPTARVVLVARRPLDGAWWGSPWAASITALPVGPLASGAASAFLAARGVDAPGEVEAVVAWAEGHPLSLTLAAAVRGAHGRALDAVDLAALESDLLDQLTGGRLLGGELVSRDRLVLAVASLAPAVDADLLDAVVPGRPGDEAERWLRGLPFAERLGHRVTLHQRVRRLLTAQLRECEPDVERDLRLRIIDHLTDPRRGHQAHLMIEVREVLAPPQDHGVTPSQARSSAWRVAVATLADVDGVAALLSAEDPSYAAWVGRWVQDAPGHVLVVRDARDDVVAVTTWATTEALPAAFVDDPVLRTWLEVTASWTGATLLHPVTEIAVPAADLAEVSALVLTSVVQRCGLTDFRRWVVPRKPPAPDPVHCGGVHEPRLDLVVGGLRLPGHVIDYGPGGAIGAMREQAHAASTQVLPARPGPTGSSVVTDVREALRHFHDPLLLATSPLARGDDPATRAASVVVLLRDGVAAAFGAGRDARLQREVLERGYLDPDASHTRAMHALHLSRTTYFRRLREATATLATWLGATTSR